MRNELEIINGVPTLTVKPGDKFSDVLVRSGLAKSKREARYLMKAGAITLYK